jgi:hypothetical protein
MGSSESAGRQVARSRPEKKTRENPEDLPKEALRALRETA